MADMRFERQKEEYIYFYTDSIVSICALIFLIYMRGLSMALVFIWIFLSSILFVREYFKYWRDQVVELRFGKDTLIIEKRKGTYEHDIDRVSLDYQSSALGGGVFYIWGGINIVGELRVNYWDTESIVEYVKRRGIEVE